MNDPRDDDPVSRVIVATAFFIVLFGILGLIASSG